MERDDSVKCVDSEINWLNPICWHILSTFFLIGCFNMYKFRSTVTIISLISVP